MPKQSPGQIIKALEAMDNITLHFQEKAQRINVRAYTGYDREKKRSSYALIGSMGRFDYEPNDRLKAVLDGSERIAGAFNETLEKYKEEKAEASKEFDRRMIKDGINRYAKSLADGIEMKSEDDEEITAELAANVYASIKRAEAILRKHGHKKTAKD